MPWIKEIDVNDAEGKLKEYYEELVKNRGKVSNILKIQSLNPDSMKEHLDLYMSIMFSKSGLKRDEREMIAVVVSSLNVCEYCINHHAEALNHYWKDDEKIQKLIKDFRHLDLSGKQKTMLEYSEKLTLTPSEVNEEDISNLREVGFTDENILNINLIVSYFNFVNRIALGLGVEFNEEEMKGYKY